MDKKEQSIHTCLQCISNRELLLQFFLVLSRASEQFETDAPTLYGRILAILDFISGMTDIYALDLYRKLTGMSLPTV